MNIFVDLCIMSTSTRAVKFVLFLCKEYYCIVLVIVHNMTAWYAAVQYKWQKKNVTTQSNCTIKILNGSIVYHRPLNEQGNMITIFDGKQNKIQIKKSVCFKYRNVYKRIIASVWIAWQRRLVGDFM